MDKEKKTTHDFMNVESFSQLPFIRRPHGAPFKVKGIRLFGIEFGSDMSAAATTTIGEDSAADSLAETTSIIDEETATVIKENDRRFECHYCCRNFPTSQALGGHQNAHKRERQHAKRAHLQSAAVIHNNNSLADAHIYGLMNYSRLTGAAAAASAPSITYPSWTSSAAGSSTFHRYYRNQSSYSHQPPPINGSPLGLWRRIPSANTSSVHSHHHHASIINRDRSMQHRPLPLFASDDEELKPSHHHMQVAMGGGSSGSSSRMRFVYESKPSSQDHVNLDLRL